MGRLRGDLNSINLNIGLIRTGDGNWWWYTNMTTYIFSVMQQNNLQTDLHKINELIKMRWRQRWSDSLHQRSLFCEIYDTVLGQWALKGLHTYTHIHFLFTILLLVAATSLFIITSETTWSYMPNQVPITDGWTEATEKVASEDWETQCNWTKY